MSSPRSRLNALSNIIFVLFGAVLEGFLGLIVITYLPWFTLVLPRLFLQ